MQCYLYSDFVNLTKMEPMKEAISVRLAKLSSQFFGKHVISELSSHAFKRALHKEGLLDALTVLYDECNNENIMKHDDYIAKFVDKYRHILAELRRMRVNVNDFDVKNVIGKGHFGVVHVVKEKHTGDVYAMKSLRKDEMLKQSNLAFYEEERDIMAFTGSSWIVKLHYAFQDSTNLYLVMEYCVGGDLATLLERRGPLEMSQAIFYLAQLNQALAAIHNMGYLHRDLKPPNVLIDRCGHIKLGDFGSAAQVNKNGKASSRVPVGTLDYIAPELLRALQEDSPTAHGTAVDYWSLGIIAYELVTLQRPFNGTSPGAALTLLEHYSSRKCPLDYPSNAFVPDSYRDLVTSLLNVDPKKRFNYLETLRHPIFKDIPWNTIRDQVPPFVPIISSPDDTSNFPECEIEKSRPNPAMFRSRNSFSGRNLPFVGFTYAYEAWQGDVKSTDCSSSENESTGFGDTLSTTALHLPSASSRETWKHRELENMRARIVEVESRAVEAESRVLDAEARLDAMKTERDRAKSEVSLLEGQVTQLTKQNQKLKRKIDTDSKERRDIEAKSMELMNSAKMKLSAQSKSQIDDLNAKLRTKESKIISLDRENNRIKAKMADTLQSLERANVELNSLKKLQTNYKDTMAKARNISRQSIVGLEQVSTESANQIQTLTSSLEKESKAKRLAENKLEDYERESRRLQIELAECKKDYEDLKKNFKALECEKVSLESRSRELETRVERKEKLEQDRVVTLENRLATERERCAALSATIQELKHRISESERREKELEKQHERTERRLREKLDEWDSERVRALAELHSAKASDERHKDKVAELECLVMRLEQDVSKLELERENTSHSTSDLTAHAQMELLKEQLARMESQLENSREEVIALKQETRKANTALWKKEKEFADIDLDKRIMSREMKQLEEKVKKLTEEKASLTTSYIENKKELEEQLSKMKEELNATKSTMRSLQLEISRKEREIKTTEEHLSSTSQETIRMEAEIDRYKNDIKKLKCELQYSENRRLKYETEVTELREDLKKCEEDRLTVREQNASLKASLHERTTQAESLQTNYKVLQDACTILEEQLVDLEQLADMWEKKNKQLEGELEKVRSELDNAQDRASNNDALIAEWQKKTDQLEKENMAWKEQANGAQLMIDHLQQRLSERESRIGDLEVELQDMRDERIALERRTVSQDARLGQLHEETSALLTTAHQLRQKNGKLQMKLEGLQEELNQCREDQQSAKVWWKAREIKAEATMKQQAKLIDFLQVKVEEFERKRNKKTLGTMLFGKSTPSTPIHTPLRENRDPQRLLHSERQNRELKEELSRLKLQLENGHTTKDKSETKTILNEITNTSKVRKILPLTNCFEEDNSDKFEGWLQLHKKLSCERRLATVNDLELRWSGRVGDERARLMAHNVTASHPLGTALTPSQRDRAFVVSSQPGGEQILCVAETLQDKSRFLELLFKKNSDLNAELTPLVRLLGCEITCAIEVEDELFAIGTDKGLYSYKRGDTQPVPVDGVGPISWMRGTPAVVAFVSSSRCNVSYCSRTLLASVLKRAACVKPRLELIDLNLAHGVLCVELMSSRFSKERNYLAVSSDSKLTILKYEPQTCKFSTQRTLNLNFTTNCMLFTPHSLLVASKKLYEIDLSYYTCEEFLDPADSTLDFAINAYKKNVYPIEIIRINDKNGDRDFEYLVCYNDFGVFVDEYGKRSRSEEVKWPENPSKLVYRKPFLFVVLADRVELIKIDESAFRIPPCECDAKSTTSTLSEFAVDKCTVRCERPKFLAKSLKAGTIFVRTGNNSDEYTVVALSGDLAFKKIGLSLETLNTVDDTDSCKNVKFSIDQPDGTDYDNASISSNDSGEPRTNFLADIRRRARQIKLREYSKFKPSIHTVDETSSESRKGIDCPDGKDLSEDSSKDCHVAGKTTAEICGEMFVQKKMNGK